MLSTDEKNFAAYAGRLDLIIDTVSADHDFTPYLGTLKIGGTQVLVGAAPLPNKFRGSALIFGRKQLVGSLIGGIKETRGDARLLCRKSVL